MQSDWISISILAVAALRAGFLRRDGRMSGWLERLWDRFTAATTRPEAPGAKGLSPLSAHRKDSARGRPAE